MKNLSVESLQAWLGWSKRAVLRVSLESLGHCVFLAALLWQKVAPRFEIVLVALGFVVRGMISPRKAWMKMHDSSLYAMLDSED